VLLAAEHAACLPQSVEINGVVVAVHFAVDHAASLLQLVEIGKVVAAVYVVIWCQCHNDALLSLSSSIGYYRFSLALVALVPVGIFICTASSIIVK
jgi:hypothetical protein